MGGPCTICKKMSKLFLILLASLFVIVCGAIPSSDLPISIPRKRTTNPVYDSVEAKSTNNCRGLRIDCGSCTSVMICNYQNQTVGGYDCASTDPTRPYCTGEGVCSSTIDASCQVQSDLCPTKSNYYPDPANCGNAFYCDDEYYASKSSAPSSGYVFNFSSQTWSLRRSPADCFEINCFATGKQNTWVAYKPAPQLSIYCGTYGPMIFECPGMNQIFNESKKQCEFSCLKEGSFAHPTDTKLYYLCLPTTNGKLQFFEQSCPGSLNFNKASLKCS